MIYQNHIKHTQLDIKVIYQAPVKSVQSFTFLTSLLIPNSFIQSETFIKALSFFKKAACLLQGLHRNLFKWRHIKDYIKNIKIHLNIFYQSTWVVKGDHPKTIR